MHQSPSPTPLVRRRKFRWSLAVGVALITIASSAFSGATTMVSAAHVPHATFTVTSSPSSLLSGSSLQHSPFTSTVGTGLQNLVNATIDGPVAPTSPVAFTVGFALQNQSLLEQIINEQSTPGSPMFQHWLTLEQENAMFAANPVEVQNTINYFTSLGFHVATRGPISVSFTGPAASVDTAFQTQLVNVRLGSGAMGLSNALALSLPAPIAGGIATVNGLNTAAEIAHPTHMISPGAMGDEISSSAMLPQLAPTGLTTAYLNTSQAFNFTNNAFMWIYYYSQSRHVYRQFQILTPGSLDHLYNASQLLDAGYNGNSTGTPVRIAIVMAGGINPDDIKGYGKIVFNNPNAIWSRLTPYPVDGSFTTNGTLTYTDGVSGEMALDIEYSATMALGAHIEAVYGPCLCTNVLDDDYATIYALPSSTFPNIISNSWGGDEDRFGNLYGPNWQNSLTMHYYFMLLDARGATVLASSADGGGFDTGTGMLAGSYPATDPYVLSVDGVRTAATDNSGQVFPYTNSIGQANITVYTLYDWPLHVDSAVKLSSQSFWYEPITNTTLYNSPPEASGGFGTSYWFNQTWFEHGIGVPDLGRSLGSSVAAEADFNQTIFFDGTFEFFYGGTSFACPTTAGEFALIEDYLGAHGHSTFLGDGNVATFWVGNAWLNGNLSLNPYYDVVNGTSYWGNAGVTNQYSYPPGQKFPVDASGQPTYGDTLKGWDFPTGWGTMNVYNFAVDLNTLLSLPGTFSTLNAAQTGFDSGAWAYMVLNKTYNFHLNASLTFAASNPTVTIKFIGSDGNTVSFQPTLTYTPVPSNGYNFQIDTSQSPFNTPGLIIFEAGNATTPTAGFAYDWISYPVPPGTLTVEVVAPNEPGGEVGGYPQFNPWPFGYSAPISVSPSCCTAYPNTFTVKVTFNGAPVYNAKVDASIPDPSVLAWQGSRAQGATDGNGRPGSYLTSSIVSQTFTNVTGYAVVNTWNVITPTTYTVTASYGTASANTTYDVLPGPNVGTTDAYGGLYSGINTVAFILKQLRQPINNATENLWVPNSVNQSGLYTMDYGWAGELIPIHVNDYQGNPMGGTKVWFGNMDLGGENRFYGYKPTFGIVGVTNQTGTTGQTDGNGNSLVYIPQNESMNFFVYPNGTDYSGFGYLAASIPGAVNRTFSYFEPCAPTLPNPKTTISCQYNDTYERNYTSVPLLILPDPVAAWTATPSKVTRDFFGEGSQVQARVSVHLPTNDPWITGIGFNWDAGLEHVVDAKAYVDGIYEGDLSPDVPPNWQTYNSSVNMTGTFAPGVHVLEVVVNDSLGHIFTSKHTFIVGSVTFGSNFGSGNTYTVVPYNLTWAIDIPAAQMNNHTFNQSLDVRYVTGGCGGSFNPCPTVVNLSERVKYGVVNYYQLINLTMLNLDHFYGGAAQLPDGQYQIILWLNANHSGSIVAQANTYLVFDAVSGQINGPGPGATVPLGNVTISYSYIGSYVQHANLSVYRSTDLVSPIFNVLAFVPGTGLRGGAATWTAVVGGPYVISLSLGTPYTNTTYYNESITVIETSGLVYYNASSANLPLGNMNPAVTATILALVAAILGLLVGVWVAPALRGGPAAGATKTGPKPWEEGQGPKQAGLIICPVCKDEFSTEFALHEHQKIVHGIEA